MIMKFVPVFFVSMFFVVGLSAQVTTLKNDIPESQYLAEEAKAKELIAKANYRSVWTLDYFEDRSKNSKLSEKKLREVLLPNKWRTVEETFYEKPTRDERIWDGKFLYSKTNDGPWEKWGRGNGSGSGGGVESGQIKNQFRFLPSIDYEGGKADFYELVSVRTANKFSQTSYVVVKYIRTTRTWYSTDGKLLKKIEETMIEGREEMSRETSTYKYDPLDLTIEAPIK